MTHECTKQWLVRACLIFLASVMGACDAGIPVRIRIDQFTLDVSLDELVDNAQGELVAQGILPAQSPGFPELWPDNLPAVKFSTTLTTPVVPVDMSPEEGDDNFDDFEDINKLEKVIKRIEINRFILRVEKSSLTVALPELALQIADDVDASTDDRLAWRTIGILPGGGKPGTLEDIEFEFLPGGESILNAQMGDDAKEFAMRLKGNFEVDTAANPRRPGGEAAIRLIAVATFFLDPTGAL
ncbi:MAG: hypothetical protein R3C68_00660 [Myxococcota bacterium]